ncbi:ferric reduction oxidase 8, mitochondrial [Juglans microcarpa x Juglans regia]|uniref:ferric reduction oxidase 8, mitochondrial n=1 Tax=Juglans microcarpa x Juglans regia TaxID=2249226 RepID=UPI001B7F2C45|nr:ferric reduction oxidase 8, mitochondrial [Juglans microcarpa x Juglans regia]
MAKAILLAITKVSMILLFSGWISLWLLKPTQLWTRKWKGAEETARSTVLGYYGLDFLVYTFPLIALAITGLVYLDLKAREPKNRQGRTTHVTFSNPVVVNSLIGVLSGIEILAVFLFVLFLAWTFYAHISNDFKKLMPDKQLKLNLWQLKYLRVATRFGLLAEACLALLLLPILRGLAIFRLLGIQFEASVRYHIWVGTAMLTFATLHGASTLFIWGVSHHIQDEIWKWQKTGRIYLAGEISLVTGLVIWITALPQIRRKKFELFYYTHHLYIVFLVFFLFHGGDRHFYMVFPGIFLFGLDKILRIVQSRPESCILAARVFPSKAIELILPKDPSLKYTPTSVLFMKIPSISKCQWHSFSITSSSSVNDDSMSVIIKCEGWWTNSLYDLIQADLDSDSDQTKCIPIAVEGPYGPASVDFLRYDSLLMIAGGIGITPFLSILQETASAQNSSKYRFPTRVQLIYVVKKSQDVCVLNSISSLVQSQSTERWHLKLKVFVTQEVQDGPTVRELLCDSSQVRTAQFNTKCSNYAIYGLESLLCIAALAGFASIVFLVFLICLNHIFVPSQKKASKEKTPSWVADLLLISSFVIALICSTLVAIILRWRRLKNETPLIFQKQGKAMDVESRIALEEHEVHFGGRPDFQDIFAKFPTETGGSDIGVMVCGPESMKKSVATVCQQKSQGFKIGGAKKNKPYFSFHPLNFTL